MFVCYFVTSNQYQLATVSPRSEESIETQYIQKYILIRLFSMLLHWFDMYQTHILIQFMMEDEQQV